MGRNELHREARPRKQFEGFARHHHVTPAPGSSSEAFPVDIGHTYTHLHQISTRTKNADTDTLIPAVPRNAVAEVSKIGNYRRGELL